MADFQKIEETALLLAPSFRIAMSSSSSPASGPVDPVAEAAAAAAAEKAAQEFYREVWVLLSVAVLAIILRTYARYRAVGFRNFQPDDVLVWIALVRLDTPCTFLFWYVLPSTATNSSMGDADILRH